MEIENIDLKKTVKIYLYGTWYRVYDNDAKIVSFITNYHLFEDPRNRRLSVGFPEESINYVSKLLKKNQINFLIKNDSTKIINFKDENKYDLFLHDDIFVSSVKKSRNFPSKFKGEIIVRYVDDNEDLLLTIGENIDQEAELVKEVLKHNEKDLIQINGEKIYIIKKNIIIE